MPLRILLMILFVLISSLLVLSCGQVENISNLFASPTPTATATFTPSPTPSPTATFTPSPTPLPSGVTTEKLTDGTTFVKDYDNKYELELPQEWVVVPLTKEDLANGLEQAARDNPDFSQMAEAFKQMDPAIIRLIGLDKNIKYDSNSYPTLLSITTISDEVASSMPMAFVTAMIEDNVFKGSRDTTWDVKENVNGVEIGIVQGTLKAPTPTGNKVDVVEKALAFQSNHKLILIEILTPKEYGSQVLPAADQIIDTIQLAQP